ncbi:hypothetical protein J0A78_12870 [Providencia rettgeri]|uniref:hypothetical protein n=17 Tax=Providencia rettgeri TaxID=587 RepID=UPI0019D43B72|nr:hypothetical protein [Providencia rettgeri]MBN7843620.1 hypothetical protein [Providencia rettgeri]MBN7923711.1 hypothetical protein [Providencia rettgeri]MBO2885034.1 hypothetical protein [Providencia rettgeri]MBP1368468.1 hypothetical protein [Providencia rettgeri]MBP1442816.1 hypothetical protein [Providencia rettgeri]
MSNLALDLKIEGDFIDSFIYSGVLYLLDSEFTFTSYSWNSLCDFILKRNGFKFSDARCILDYSKDNRKTNASNNYIDTYISEKEINSLRTDMIEIKTWPSDINIFSNKLYFSGDDGVFFINTNHKTALFDKNKIKKIFGMKSFAISPNTNNRIALAVGNEGVFTSTLKHQDKFPTEVQVSNKSCIDIDWINESLFINSDNLSIESFCKIASKNNAVSNEIFLKIRDEFKKNKNIDDNKLNNKSYREYINFILNKKPETLKLNDIYKYGWSSGDSNFILNKNNNIIAQNKISGNKVEISTSEITQSLIKLRTSGCGTVMESNIGELFITSGNGVDRISDDFVSWRVYPRAKNHANHLHIINDENINIKIFNKKESIFNTFLSVTNEDDYKYDINNLIG